MTARCGRALPAAVFFAAMLVVPMTARAQGNADEAELQFQLGAEAYQEGNYRAALEHFLASNRLVPNRNVVYNVARVYERLGRFPDAHRYYVEALAGETNAQTRAEIEASLVRVAASVGVVDVTTEPSGATIYVGRRDLGSVGVTPHPLALEPGRYRILVEREGYEPASSDEIEARRGERLALALELRLIVGTIRVSGEAGVAVRLDADDGPVRCRVPCEIEATPGPHVLFFSKRGSATVQRPVTVEARETVEVVAGLEALTGSLLVRADERDALVEVDGEPHGFTPAVIPNVPIGRRTVRVTLRGYRPVEREVDVRQGEQTLVDDVTLVPLREVGAASRSVQRIEDAPASVTILGAQELEAFGYPTIFEAIRGVRGFALTFDSIYANAAVRGLGQPNDYNNRIIVLGDGATLNENILFQPFITYDGRLDLDGVERIEIVRGPGSVLYGTGAVSGVINLVPDSRDAPTELRISAGTAGEGVARGRASFNYRIDDDTGVRAALAGARSDGWDAGVSFDQDGDGVPEDLVAHGLESFEAVNTNGRAWLGPLTLQWYYHWRDIRIPTGSFDSNFDDPRNMYDDRRGLLELRFEPELSDEVALLARVYGNYYRFGLDYVYDIDDGAGGIFAQPYFEEYVGVWFGGEARVVWEPSEALSLSAGSEAAFHPVVTIDAAQIETNGATTRILDVAAPYSVIAAYGLVDWDAASWLRISAGARVDFTQVEQPAENFVAVNPRLALIFRLSEDDDLKVMGGRAFRAPSAYENFYAGGSQVPSTCCGATLSPESFYQAEIEYTHRFDEDWSALGSVHGVYAIDFISTLPVPTDPDSIHFANIAEEQIVAGGDVEVRREFRGGWMFAAQYGFLQARFLESPTAAGTTPSTRVPNAPDHFGSLKGVFPIVPSLLTAATRVTLEAPRRVGVETDDETEWALTADFVLSGRADELGLRYHLGVYNLFDWRPELPVEPFLVRRLPQQGRTLFVDLTLSI